MKKAITQIAIAFFTFVFLLDSFLDHSCLGKDILDISEGVG